MSVRPGMTRQELSHRTSPQPSDLLCDLFGENINRAFLPLPGLREGVLKPEWVVIVHSEFCISLNPMCPPEHLTIYFSFMGEEKVLRAYIRWPSEETLQCGGAVLGCHPEPLLSCYPWARGFLDSDGSSHPQPMPGCVATPSFSLEKLPSLFNWWRVF